MSEYIVELNSNAVFGNKFLLGTVYLDATPVVRCRDCIRFNGRTHYCPQRDFRFVTRGDGFCAWGDRRDS